MNAAKVLVIYERLDFFYDIFKNEKTIAFEAGEKVALGWLNGNLNREISEELCPLPERFGQIIFDEKNVLLGKGKV
jgi:hypothetical protein